VSDQLSDLQRSAEAGAVIGEVVPAAASPQDQQACRTAAAACDQMAEPAAARQIVAAAPALDDERLDPTDVAERLADALAAYAHKVQLVDDVGHEPGPRVDQPLADLGWEQQRSVTVAGNDVVGHRRSYATGQPASLFRQADQTRPRQLAKHARSRPRPRLPAAADQQRLDREGQPSSTLPFLQRRLDLGQQPRPAAGRAAPIGPASGDPAP